MATTSTQVNPDTSSGFNGGLLGGLLVSGIVLLLFNIYGKSKNFVMIWVLTLVTVVIVSAGILSYYQYMACNTIHIGPLLYSLFVPFGTGIAGLGISSFITCRRPIASAFAPLLLSDDDIAKVSPQKSATSCCAPSLDLVKIEEIEPLIMGISYCFYMIFAMLFGIIGGRGYAVEC
jgi:hypothetical protein